MNKLFIPCKIPVQGELLQVNCRDWFPLCLPCISTISLQSQSAQGPGTTRTGLLLVGKKCIRSPRQGKLNSYRCLHLLGVSQVPAIFPCGVSVLLLETRIHLHFKSKSFCFHIVQPNLTTNVERISTIIPIISTIMVFLFTPFHSFRKIPQILLIAILSAIRMLHPKTAMLGGNLLEPIPKKWN